MDPELVQWLRRANEGRRKGLSDAEIEEIMKSSFGAMMVNAGGEGLSRTVLIKRTEFEHEQSMTDKVLTK